MLILFTGGRGSGKTTIASELHRICDERGISYMHHGDWREQGQLRKFWFTLYFWRFFNPKIFKVFADRARRDIEKKRSRGSLYRLYVPLIFSYYLSKLSSNKTDVVMYDTDVLTWAADKALDGTFDSKEVKDFYTKVVLPKAGKLLLVEIDTPVQEAIERSLIRDKKELSQQEIVVWATKRTRWKQARSRVVEVIATLPDAIVVRLDGIEDPKANANLIFKKIVTLL